MHHYDSHEGNVRISRAQAGIHIPSHHWHDENHDSDGKSSTTTRTKKYICMSVA